MKPEKVQLEQIPGGCDVLLWRQGVPSQFFAETHQVHGSGSCSKVDRWARYGSTWPSWKCRRRTDFTGDGVESRTRV